MAKFKVGQVVADIKGLVGGTVFASNKGGNYIRRYKKPTNKNSVKQQAVRLAFGAMTGQWRLLTEAERQSWIEGAINFPYTDSLGESRIYSGQQLFNKLNNTLTQAGEQTLASCPSPQSFPNFNIEFVTNTVLSNILLANINVEGTPVLPPNFKLIVTATGTLSAGISSPSKGRFIKIEPVFDATVLDEIRLEDAYNDALGPLLLNDVIFLGFQLINTLSGESSIVATIKSARVA
jgi:hypothetical protein